MNNKIQIFKNPPDIYRGTDFWMLNAALDTDELISQISAMHDQGVRSFIARTYIGLRSDYPGPEFMSHMETIINTASSLGMKVFLQAGYMPDAIPNLPTQYELPYLRAVKAKDVTDDAEIVSSFDDLCFIRVIPGAYLNMFDHEAVAYYIDVCYESMWEHFSTEFGKTIPSIWVDEPNFRQWDIPFPDGFEKQYLDRWGDELRPHIQELYCDVGDFECTRYRYHRLLAELIERNYFMQLQSWCRAHDLLFSGHLIAEETLQQQTSFTTAVMPFYKYFDIPGIDCLMAQMNWQRNPLQNHHGDYTIRKEMVNTTVQLCSAARQSGSNHILCEMYGVAGEDFTFRNQKYMFDYFNVFGINHRSVHGMFYSLHGRAKRAYPPHINYYQPYWHEYSAMTDYVARASAFSNFGKAKGEIVLIHPLESAWSLCAASSRDIDNNLESCKSLLELDNNYSRLNTLLEGSQIEFDYCDEMTLQSMGSVSESRLHVGCMDYGIVVLPMMLGIRSSTVEKLHEFSSSGGQIWVLGRSPERLDGIAYANPLDGIANIRFIPSMDELCDLAKTYFPETFSCAFDNRSILIRRRTDGENKYYMLFNNDCGSQRRGFFSIPGECSLNIYDASDGSVKPYPADFENGVTKAYITIPAGGSVLLESYPCCSNSQSASNIQLTMPIHPNWRLKRNVSNVLLMDYCAIARENEVYGEAIPIVAAHDILIKENYHGILRQKFTFATDLPLAGLHLVLENSAEHCITFNGTPVDPTPDGTYLAQDFETVPLPDTVIGENTVELTRYFKPLEKIKNSLMSLFANLSGVELEPAYIIGDFAVRGTLEPNRTGCMRYGHEFILTSEPDTCTGEVTQCGYPFYAGIMELETDVTIPEHTYKNAYLQLGQLCGCTGRVYVNGIDCGMTAWEPYRVNITVPLHSGHNVIKLELTNTMRNLLGPWHRTRGELGACWGGYSSPNQAWMGVTPDDPNWYLRKDSDSDVWTSSYMQLAYGVEDTAIILEI